MKKYRITKYDPSFRDMKGNYMLDDWTSYYDIGKNFYGGILTKEKYLETEAKYLQAIQRVMYSVNKNMLRVTQLEKNMHNEIHSSLTNEESIFINKIKNDLLISADDVKKLCKLILREVIWAKLESPDGDFTIEFGYDFYVYVTCKRICQKIVEEIMMSDGLFVEELGDKGTVLLSPESDNR